MYQNERDAQRWKDYARTKRREVRELEEQVRELTSRNLALAVRLSSLVTLVNGGRRCDS